MLLNKGMKKLRFQFNLGSVLTSLRTTGPWTLALLPMFNNLCGKNGVIKDINSSMFI